MIAPPVVRATDATVEEYPWGRLLWFASGALGNSETLTVGQCLIEPGRANGAHYHPNCDEVLHVLEGEIRHRIGDDYVLMSAGDTISIPAGLVHNAQNVGSVPARMAITFSTADRHSVSAD